MNKCYLLIFLFLINFEFIYSQDAYIVDSGARCEVYQGDPQGYPYCHDKLVNPNSVYIPSNSTQDSIWNRAELLVSLIITINDPNCITVDNFINLCSMLFPECIQIKNSVNETIAIPVRTCRANCQTSYDACGLSIVPKSQLDCAGFDNTTQGPLFPLVGESYNLTSFNNDTDYSMKCMDPVQFISNATIAELEDCPSPLIYHKSEGAQRAIDEEHGYYFATNTSNCVVNCPVPLFSRKEWDNLFLMSDIMSILSTFLSLYLIVTYTILNQKWVPNDKLLNGFIISVFLISLSGAIQAFHGTEKTFCPTPARSAIQSDHVCGAVGIIFHIGAVCAIGFWTIMCFELWWSIKFFSKKIDLFKYYLTAIIIVCLVFTIVPAANHNIYYGKANVVCWLKSAKFMNWCFWYPLGACITVSTGFIFLVIFEIYKIVKANGRSGILELQIKPILMILLFYCTFLYLFSYNFYIQGHMQGFLDYIETYFSCILNAKVNNLPSDSCSLIGPPVGSVGTFAFFIRSYGVFCFILYGTSAKARKIWLNSPVLNNRYAKPIIQKFFSKNSSKVTGTTDSGNTGSKNTTDKNNPSLAHSTTPISRSHYGLESGMSVSRNIESDESDGDDEFNLGTKNIELSTMK